MDFRDLDVWNKAHQLTLQIYEVTEDFPEDEKHRLTDQILGSWYQVLGFVRKPSLKGKKNNEKIFSTRSLAKIT